MLDQFYLAIVFTSSIQVYDTQTFGRKKISHEIDAVYNEPYFYIVKYLNR